MKSNSEVCKQLVSFNIVLCVTWDGFEQRSVHVLYAHRTGTYRQTQMCAKRSCGLREQNGKLMEKRLLFRSLTLGASDETKIELITQSNETFMKLKN